MAFLFGSRSKGHGRLASDWDIGVYLRQENEQLETTLWNDLEKIVGAEVDFVILNRAPATLIWRVVAQGKILAINDRRIYLDVLLSASDEANYFYEISREYDEIFQRSSSLSAVDQTRLRRILQFLKKHLEDYEHFRKMTWQTYSGDRFQRWAVERWVEQLMNSVVDVAKIIFASEHRPIPETYIDIVNGLATLQFSPANGQELFAKLAGWVKLRNIVAHDYLNLHWKNISSFLSQAEPWLNQFLEWAKDFVEKSAV